MRVAVIAAPNPRYYNTGMLTVDLAAARVLARVAPGSTVSWYTLHTPDAHDPVHPSVNASELPFDWQPLTDAYEDVCSHDAILLWGDFLQARHYFVEDASKRLTEGGSFPTASRDDALRLLYKHLLFSEASERVLNRVIVFGSSILFNRQADYQADDYGTHVTRLFRHSAGAWMREPISAAKVQAWRPQSPAACIGTDAAFLLQDEDLAGLATTSWLTTKPSGGCIGVFFGTRTRAPLGFLGFLRQMADRLGLELEWVPWFPVHDWLDDVPSRHWKNPAIAAFILLSRHRLKRLMRRGTHYSAGDLLASLSQYTFIVTDTYHLCVNAWRAGVPAICFGNPDVAPGQLTLSDYKKQVLYQMYDAGDFYFNTSSLRGTAGRKRVLGAIQDLIANRDGSDAITRRIRAHARRTEQLFADDLTRLLRH